MDEQEKPFDIVSIVILIMIGLANDAAEIVFDLLASTGVGLPGEAIMEPINVVFDGIVTAWFFYKVGFGWPSILQLIDDGLELVGVPGRTLSIGLGIWITNHPSSKVAKFAKVVGTVESLGESELGEIAEGAQAAEQAEGAAGAATSAETTTVEGELREAGTAAGEGGENDAQEQEGERQEKSAREKEIEEELTPEAEKNPVEVEGQRLREGPTAEDFSRNEQDETEAAPTSLPPKKPSASEKYPRNTKPKLQDIRDLDNVPPSEENEDEEKCPVKPLDLVQ